MFSPTQLELKNRFLHACELASNEILKIYSDPNFETRVQYKDDRSPLTEADKAAHLSIQAVLQEAFPSIPIISEEGKDISYEERNTYTSYFLVDPLDGTKEFIKRNGEFTINIAYMVENRPIAGMIYLPTSKTAYWGHVPSGVASKVSEGQETAIQCSKGPSYLKAAVSRSHLSEKDQEILSQLGVKETLAAGSALKFTLIAEGLADVYVRNGPTMEWDTAAGQAIVEAAGGIFTAIDGSQFPYGKKELLNDSFIVKAF